VTVVGQVVGQVVVEGQDRCCITQHGSRCGANICVCCVIGFSSLVDVVLMCECTK